MLFDYDKQETWPLEVVEFLDENRSVLDDWLTEQRFASPYQYDEIIRQLYAVLRPHDILAWHNTSLMAREAAVIVAEGMFLASVETLLMRIDAAKEEGVLRRSSALGAPIEFMMGCPMTAFSRRWHPNASAESWRSPTRSSPR